MISARLKFLRNLNQLTQQNVSSVINVDRSTYAFYEAGTTQPPLSCLCKIARLYNVTVGFLVGEEDLVSDERIKLHTSTLDSYSGLLPEERALLMIYRLLPDKRQDQVYGLASELAQKTQEEIDEQFAEYEGQEGLEKIAALEKLDKYYIADIED